MNDPSITCVANHSPSGDCQCEGGIWRGKRSCTDSYCLLAIFIFLCGWLAVGYYAYWNGDIARLIAPVDSYGRTCGVDEDVRQARYLLFFDITECVSLSVFLFGCPTKQICVRQCPQENWFSDRVIENPPRNWRLVRERLICEDPSISKTINSAEALKRVVQDRRCAPYYVKSTSAFFQLCLPNPLGSKDVEKSYGAIETTKTARNYFNYVFEIFRSVEKDVRKCWHFLTIFVATATVICLFTIIIMGVITKIFVWTVLWLILFILLYSTFITYLQYDNIRMATENATVLLGNAATQSAQLSNVDDQIVDMTDVDDPKSFYSQTFYGQLSWLFRKKQTWLFLSVSSGILFVLFTLLVIFLRSRIDIAVMLIGEGSKAINTIKSTLCMPLITRLLQLCVIFWFLLIFFYVKSLGNAVHTVQGLRDDQDCRCNTYRDGDWCLPRQFNIECSRINGAGACTFAKCSFVEFRSPKLKFYLQSYNLFGLLWALYFVSGLTRIVLSLCFKTWYWTYDKREVPFFTLCCSIYTAVRYHLGTIALGSFLIATCGFIRTLLQRTYQAAKRTDGLVTQCTVWSMRCCFWALQKFLIFVSVNAYVMCALTGDSFFRSAQDAFALLTRNLLRVVVLDKVLDFLMLVGKLAVTFVMVTLSYFTFSSTSLRLNYPWVPTVFVGLITWIISSSFFAVYTVAVDTLFLSFLMDSEENDGSQTKPYYMSQRLKYILEEKKDKTGSRTKK